MLSKKNISRFVLPDLKGAEDINIDTSPSKKAVIDSREDSPESPIDIVSPKPPKPSDDSINLTFVALNQIKEEFYNKGLIAGQENNKPVESVDYNKFSFVLEEIRNELIKINVEKNDFLESLEQELTNICLEIATKIFINNLQLSQEHMENFWHEVIKKLSHKTRIEVALHSTLVDKFSEDFQLVAQAAGFKGELKIISSAEAQDNLQYCKVKYDGGEINYNGIRKELEDVFQKYNNKIATTN